MVFGVFSKAFPAATFLVAQIPEVAMASDNPQSFCSIIFSKSQPRSANRVLRMIAVDPEEILTVDEADRLQFLDAVFEDEGIPMRAKLVAAVHVGPNGFINFLAWLAANPELATFAHHRWNSCFRDSFITEEQIRGILCNIQVIKAISSFKELVGLNQARRQPIPGES